MDAKTALRLYNRVIDENSYLITEALPALVAVHKSDGTLAELDKRLRAHLARFPKTKTDIAYTAIVNDIGGIGIIDECVEEYMLSEPTLADFIDLQTVREASGKDRQAALDKVRAALSHLARTIPRYQCKECGFSSQKLLWQCPSCRDWETQRPFSTVAFDSLLQRGGGM